MRSMLLHLGLVAFLWASHVGIGRAADDPRAIVDQAVKAMGGEAKLAQTKVVQTKIKGTLHAPEGAVPFTAVTLTQPPGQYKHEMAFESGGAKVLQTQLYNGNDLSIVVNGDMMRINSLVRTSLQQSRYADQLTGLTMLREQAYQLSLLGETKVHDKVVVGLKVTSPNQPEVKLFFEKGSGLLVKAEFVRLDTRLGQPVLQETYFSDYAEPDTSAADEQLLKGAAVAVDGAGLLEYLRKLSQAGGNKDKMAALIRQLGSESFPEREKAMNDLIALGAPAVPLLKEALKNSDLEVVRRAERCLQKIEKSPTAKAPEVALPTAAVRLIARRKPSGAAEVLLSYLPSAPDEETAMEVRAALAAVALADGKPDKVLEEALKSDDPLRRAAAAEALGKTPPPPGRKIVIEGLKRPRKVTVYRGGKKFMEWEVSEVAFFNKFDDKLFVKP